MRTILLAVAAFVSFVSIAQADQAVSDTADQQAAATADAQTADAPAKPAE